MSSDSAFQQLALEAWRSLSQFEFELRTELRRLGGLEPRPASFENVPREPATAARDCGNALDGLLKQYEESLNTTLSAHARAMVNRQLQQVRRDQEALVRLQTAA